MLQRVGKLPEKLASVQIIGIAPQQQGIAFLELGDQTAHVEIGAKNVGPGTGEVFLGAAQTAAVVNLAKEIFGRHLAGIVGMLQLGAEQGGVQDLVRQVGV